MRKAVQHLKRADQVMGNIIEQVGPCRIKESSSNPGVWKVTPSESMSILLTPLIEFAGTPMFFRRPKRSN